MSLVINNNPKFLILRTLKIDAFSKTDLAWYNEKCVIVRSLNCQGWIKNWIGRLLANREAKVITHLAKQIKTSKTGVDYPNFPVLLYKDSNYLIRSYISGCPLNRTGKISAAYFKKAKNLVKLIHRNHLVHNDLEKAENWIVMDNGEPGIIDFQIAMYFKRPNKLMHLLMAEDLRHVLKNKARFCSENLNKKEQDILKQRPKINQWFLGTFKPIYNFITRKIFRYSDRKSSKYSH